jgi:uncharacterized protein (DUF1684 family)
MNHKQEFMAILLFCLTACQSNRLQQPDPETYANEMKTWDDQRIHELKDRGGWLNLAGLFWLRQGKNTVGSDSTNDVIFPGTQTPPTIGTFIVDSVSVTLEVAEGVDVHCEGQEVNKLDMTPGIKANVAELNNLVWFILRRDERFAVRLRDLNHPNLAKLDHVERYPLSLKWRIKATFVPFGKPRKIMVPTVIGIDQETDCYGTLEFRYKGKKYSLLPTGGTIPYFIVFADATSALETYGGGRFLMTESLPDGSLILDFNKAQNPPCAFTPYATCPLPLKENYLPFPVTAGEKKVTQFEHGPATK